MPLHLVLTIPFVLQVVGVVGLVGYLSYRSSEEAVKDLAHQLMAETSDRVISDLNHYLESAHQINQANIAALRAGAINLQDLDQLHQYLILQHRQWPNVTTLLLATSNGDFRTIHRVMPTEQAADLSAIQPTDLPFEAGRSDADDPSRLDLYTVDETGQLGRYLQTIEQLDGRDRPWYQQAVATGKPGWSEPFQIGATNLLALNAYTPFYDASQQLEGVFSVNLALERLNGFLQDDSNSISARSQIFIVERNGLLVAHSGDEQPFVTTHVATPSAGGTPLMSRPGEIEFHRIAATSSANPVIKAASQALTTQWANLETIQSAQELEMDLEMKLGHDTQARWQWTHASRQERHHYFLNVTPYQEVHGLDWLIVTVVPQADVMETIYSNLWRTVILCGLALMGTMGSGIWMTRRLARSLIRLTQATQAFTVGRLDTFLPSTRITELEILTHAFRQMAMDLRRADQLQQNYAQHLEQQVAEQTAALTEAQRIAQIGSWEFDVATGISTWSVGQFRILGMEPTTDLPRYPAIFELLPLADQPKMRAAVERAIAYGTPYIVEHGLIRPDQSIGYMISRGEAVRDDQGRVVKLVGTIMDITERKQTELALRESELKFSSVFQSSPDPAWIATLAEGRILNVNHRFSLFIGYSNSELVGKTCCELKLWHRHEDFRQFHHTLTTTGKLEDFEVEFRLKSGEQRTVLISATVSQINHQDCVIGSLKDISERKLLQQALQESKASLSNILNSAIAAITRMKIFEDGRWDIIHVSAGCEVISGYTAAELMADQNLWLSRIYPGDWEAIAPQIFANIFAEKTETYEYRLIDRANNVRWISQSNRSCWDAAQSCWWVTAVALDITSRKHVEEELKQAKQQLEYRIADLNQRNQEMELLSQMSDCLQACCILDDAYRALPRFLQLLFPQCSGNIFILDLASKQANVVASWGTQSHSALTFSVEDCWTLCRRKEYRFEPNSLQQRCHYISIADHEAIATTHCIPILAQDQILGVFHLSANTSKTLSEAKRQLAHTVTKQVSLAIANLQLRAILQQQSICDPLTGLYNRRYLEDALSQELLCAERHRHPVSVVMLDIDYFKQFNDTYGHDAGDHVLQTVATELKALVRGSDIVCRYGGEEMTLILPETYLEEARSRAEEIREAISQLLITYKDQCLRTLTVSLGVSTFPQHGSTGESLMQAADVALYRAKAAGRNQVAVAI